MGRLPPPSRYCCSIAGLEEGDSGNSTLVTETRTDEEEVLCNLKKKKRASVQDKDNTEGRRVKNAAIKSPAKKTRKKQKSVNCNSFIPEDESMHPPPHTEEPTTEEAPDVAKGDFPMEPESVEGHTSTPANDINGPDVVDIFFGIH
ncbi:hypothetical protein MRB53_001867 [Persea americana]|uniref:Uncharacterized protein n=1 Tax=Persea americana TaxID=3435 RepID=A0ACC2MT43_PERAE|nr:hypothetical protein MRB53_001867 [Persea americana]